MHGGLFVVCDTYMETFWFIVKKEELVDLV
jgi:hypothetical protein